MHIKAIIRFTISKTGIIKHVKKT